MWVVIHICMETTVGIFLYSYLYPKIGKHYVFLIMSYVYSSTKLENKRVEQVLPRSRVWGRGWKEGGGGPQTMYTHVSICKNDKIKERKEMHNNQNITFPL
jgi:hypothetical protein